MHGNGKLINLWKDTILGKPPPYLPRIKNWMDMQDINTLWDIYVWEDDPPYCWVEWLMSECLVDLDDERNHLMDHLSGIALVAKGRRDQHGWGGFSGKYTMAKGSKKYVVIPTMPCILTI